MIFHLEEINVSKQKCTVSDSPLQAHILEYGLAVHEKFVPQDMRPLHKKLVDQFHVMKSSLGIQVSEGHSTGAPITNPQMDLHQACVSAAITHASINNRPITGFPSSLLFSFSLSLSPFALLSNPHPRSFRRMCAPAPCTSPMAARVVRAGTRSPTSSAQMALAWWPDAGEKHCPRLSLSLCSFHSSFHLLPFLLLALPLFTPILSSFLSLSVCTSYTL